jgi:C-terminal processing protease CtpA/Prc
MVVDNFAGNMMGGLLVFAVVIIVIFLVCREIVCWYWKINQNVALLTEIRDLLAMKENTRGVDQGLPTVAQRAVETRLRITGVSEGEARRRGIQVGDILDTYNGSPIESDERLNALMKQHEGQEHILKIIRESKQMEFMLTAGPLGIMTMRTAIQG